MSQPERPAALALRMGLQAVRSTWHGGVRWLSIVDRPHSSWGWLTPRHRSALSRHGHRIPRDLTETILVAMHRAAVAILVFCLLQPVLPLPLAPWGADEGWVGGSLSVAIALTTSLAAHLVAGRKALELEKQQRAAEAAVAARVHERVTAQLEWQEMIEPMAMPEEVPAGLDMEGLRRAERDALFQAASHSSQTAYARALQAGRKHLPGVPRSIVRYVNRVRILMVLGVRWQVFAGPDAIRPESVGRWAVLAENWPQLAGPVGAEPALADRLLAAVQEDDRQRSARKDDPTTRPWKRLEAVVGDIAPGCRVTEGMVGFLKECAQEGWLKDLPRVIRIRDGAAPVEPRGKAAGTMLA